MSGPRGLSPAQVTSIREAVGTINVWEGAVRSGKTVGSLLRWLAHCEQVRHETGEIFVFGKTRETIGRNVFRPLMDRSLVGPAIASQIHYTSGAPTAKVLGQLVHVTGANDKRSEETIRGLTGKSAYGDELTVIPREFFQQALARLSVEGSAMFGTTNPGPPGHWLRKEYLLRAGDPELDLRTWHFGLDDNPFLPPKVVARIKASYTGLFYRRFVLGQWVQADGAVFDSFDEEHHVVSRVPPGTMVLAVGIDYGTVNPFHAVELGLTPDGRLIVIREWRYDSRAMRRQMTDAEYALALAEWLTQGEHGPPQFIVVDPSAASFRVQAHRDGLGALALADNEVVDGIRQTAAMFSTGRLLVHESCTGLLDELPGYSWDDEKAEKGEDVPVKLDDHGVDALRYAVRTTRALWQHQVAPPERFALPVNLAGAGL